MPTMNELKMLQALPLELKVEKTKQRIREWINHWGKDSVYISFSGGKDSTVLLDLVRSEFPDICAVFVDTGLEYPEIKKFVKTFENVEILKPDMSFLDVITKYGYPVVSKMQSQYIEQYRNGSEKMKKLRWEGANYNGVINYKISEKWKYLINSKFKISDKCCNVMKKNPIKKYNKKSGKVAIIGLIAEESIQRKKQYLQNGCNAFDINVSRPMGFWTEQDVLKYIKENDLKIASVYGEIIEENGMLRTTGLNRTGCMFCMFGVHLEKGENRFQRMKRTHPQIYDYCINKLGIGEVLDYIGVKY